MAEMGRQWYCVVDGQRYGPIDEGQLYAWIAQQRLRRTDTVWTEGMGAWQPLESVAYMFRGGLQFPTAAATHVEPHRGALVLVLGILGLFIPLLGILPGIAWYLASQDLPKMRAGMMDRSGEGMTTAGKICGIIGVVFAIIGCCGIGLWLSAFVGMMGTSF
jgi:hypothetical protein